MGDLELRIREIFGDSPSPPSSLTSAPASPQQQLMTRKARGEEFAENLEHFCKSKDVDAVAEAIQKCKASQLPQIMAVIVKSKLMDALNAIKFIDKNREDDNKSLKWIAHIIIDNPMLIIHFVGMLGEAKKRGLLTLEEVDKLMRACCVSQFPPLLSLVLSMTQGMSEGNRSKLANREKFMKLMEITVEAAKKIEALLKE